MVLAERKAWWPREEGMHPRLSEGDRRRLLDVALWAIHEELEGCSALDVDIEDFPMTLRAERASFVTLKRHGELRGCIGSVDPNRPLVTDVAKNSHEAAFADPRFEPLSTAELSGLKISVSILSRPRLVTARTEAEAAAALKPGVDGIVLQARNRQRLFLPEVWKSLGDPRQFLEELKIKAHLPPNFWSDDLRLYRFQTETFGQ